VNQWKKCRPMTLVSVIYADIRRDSLERGVKRQWGNRKRRFTGFLDAMTSTP